MEYTFKGPHDLREAARRVLRSDMLYCRMLQMSIGGSLMVKQE